MLKLVIIVILSTKNATWRLVLVVLLHCCYLHNGDTTWNIGTHVCSLSFVEEPSIFLMNYQARKISNSTILLFKYRLRQLQCPSPKMTPQKTTLYLTKTSFTAQHQSILHQMLYLINKKTFLDDQILIFYKTVKTRNFVSLSDHTHKPKYQAKHHKAIGHNNKLTSKMCLLGFRQAWASVPRSSFYLPSGYSSSSCSKTISMC